MPVVSVEFLGIPRLRTGRATLSIDAETVGELLYGIARECPGFQEACLAGGSLRPDYLLSIGGRVFTRDRATRLSTGDEVLILSADVGG